MSRITVREEMGRLGQVFPGNARTLTDFNNWISNTMFGYRKSSDIQYSARAYMGDSSFVHKITNRSSATIDEIKDNFLYDYGTLENYASRQIIIDEYFSKVHFMEEKMSLRILGALINAQVEMTQDNMEDLEKAGTPAAATAALEAIMAGERDPKKKAFIATLKAIEHKNREVARKYAEMFSLQNPIIDTINDSMNEVHESLNGAESFFMGRAKGITKKFETITTEDDEKEWIEAHKTVHAAYSEEKLLEDMKFLSENPALGNASGADTFPAGFKEYMLGYYNAPYETNSAGIETGFITDEDNEAGRNFTQTARFAEEITLLEKKLSIDKLQYKHTSSVNFTRELLKKAFHNKGGLSLSEAIPSFDGTMTPGQLSVDMEKKVGTFHRTITRTIKEMDPKEISAMGFERDSLADAVTEEYAKFFNEYSDSVKSVDSTYGLTFHRDRPGGSVQEEIFQKMFIDGIYNKMMKTNGGETLFNQIGGESQIPGEIKHSAMIDVVKNQQEGKYSLVHDNPEFKNIENEAVELHNLSLIFDKSANNELSRSNAQKLLASGNSFLSPEQKASVSDNIDLIYRGMKLTEEDMGLGDRERSPEQSVQDYIAGHNAKDHFNKNYAGKNRGTFLKMLSSAGIHLYGKKQMELFSCLGKAENPAVSSHSTTSETRECMKAFAREIDQTIQKREEIYGNPLAAMFGFAFLAVMLNVLSQAEKNGMYALAIDSTKDESEAISFVRGAEDNVGKVFRENAIMVDRNVINESVVKKGTLDEYLFRSIKAQHDFHAHHNKHLGPVGSGVLEDVKNAGDRKGLARSSRKGIKDILDNVRMTDYFNGFVNTYNLRVKEIFKGEVSRTKMKLDTIQEMSGKLTAAGFDFNNPESAENKNILQTLKSEAILNLEKKYHEYGTYDAIPDPENGGVNLIKMAIDEIFEPDKNGSRHILYGTNEDTYNELAKEFEILAEKLLLGVEKGGIPPSEISVLLLGESEEKGGATKQVKLVSKKISDNIDRLEELIKEKELILAGLLAKVENGELTDDDVAEEKSRLKEKVQAYALESNKDKEVLEKFAKANNTLASVQTKLGRMCTALLASTDEDYNLSGKDSNEKLRILSKKADPFFSQKLAFSGDGAEKEGEAIEAWKSRYSGDLSEDVVFQDMEMFDHFNEMIHNKEYAPPRGIPIFKDSAKNKEVKHGDMAVIPGKYKHVSEAVAAIKVLVLENYITSEQHLDGSKSRAKILEDLSEERLDSLIETSHLHFGMLEQVDGESVQVITVDKSENPMNIKTLKDALDIASEKYRVGVEVTGEKAAQLFKSASTFLKGVAGIDMDVEKYKSGDKRSLRKPSDSYGILIDGMYGKKDMEKLQVDLYNMEEDSIITDEKPETNAPEEELVQGAEPRKQ